MQEKNNTLNHNNNTSNPNNNNNIHHIHNNYKNFIEMENIDIDNLNKISEQDERKVVSFNINKFDKSDKSDINKFSEPDDKKINSMSNIKSDKYLGSYLSNTKDTGRLSIINNQSKKSYFSTVYKSEEITKMKADKSSESNFITRQNSYDKIMIFQNKRKFEFKESGKYLNIIEIH